MNRVWRWWGGCLVALWSGCGLAAPATPLLELARQCVERRDSNHAVFHGCVDWHSAVHGHWALLWGARTTRDQPLLTWLSHRLQPTGLAEELGEFRQHLARRDRFELPYGHAWFLQLAQESERAWGDGRLLPLAQVVYTSLRDFVRAGGGDPLATDYQNSSWALLHLARWARFRGEDGEWQELRTLAMERLQPLANFPQLSGNRGFFDPAALALLLLEEVAGWDSPVWRRIREQWRNEPLTPLSPPFRVAHQGGLNYSRAWGLAALYRREKERRWLQAWHDHMDRMAQTLPDWGGDYGRYGHWVAQFGVFALSMPPEGF